MKTNKYNKYRQEVQDYMNKLENVLLQEYGQLLPSWDIQFKLISENYQTFLDCKDKINEEGLSVRGQKDVITKHPLLAVMHTAESYLIKVLHTFGTNPMAKSKMKLPALDNEESFLDSM